MNYQRLSHTALAALFFLLSGCGIINSFGDPPEGTGEADVGFDADIVDVGDVGEFDDATTADDTENIDVVDAHPDADPDAAHDADADADADVVLSIESVTGQPAIANPAETVQLEVTVDYSGNEELSYSWSAPEGWEFVSDDAAQVELIAIAEPGQTATIEVVVSAPSGASDEGSVEISTNLVDGPNIISIEAVPERAIVGQTQVVSVEAIHPDGYELTYHWEVPDGWNLDGDDSGESIEIYSDEFDISGEVEVLVVDEFGDEMSTTVAVSTEELFCGGLGTEFDPWEICSAKFLNRVAVYDQFLGDFFVLTEDIDMLELSDEEFNTIGAAGAPFDGVFDGDGHIIDNLTIDGEGDEVGLFGRTGGDAELRNVTLTDVELSAGDQAGGLAGQNQGSIIASSVSGAISGDGEVGGLVGRNHGIVTVSMSDAFVEASGSAIGGLVGRNTGDIQESVAHGPVVGDDLVGGLVGRSEGTIIDAYATGDVEAEDYAGGLLGRNESDGTAARTFSIGAVEGIAGGLVATNDANPSAIADSYWVIESSEADGSDGGSALEDLADLRLKQNFADTWEFYPDGDFIWVIQEDADGDLRPTLRWENPCSGSSTSSCATGVCDELAGVCVACNINSEDDFGAGDGTVDRPWRICTADHLENAADSDYMNDFFELFDDVVLDSTWDPSSVIGSQSHGDFQGVFDGAGHQIEDLHIDGDEFEDNRVGLFGTIGSGAEVRNLVLKDPNISGAEQVGALAGRNEGTILNASAIGDGDVQGRFDVGGLVGSNRPGATIAASDATVTIAELVNPENVGGLVGINRGGIADSHASGSIDLDGGDYVGGLVGQNLGSITDAYATGPVEANHGANNGAYLGGLVGSNEGDITRSHASGVVEGHSELGGLVGNSSNGTIADSYATGAVTSSGWAVGGLIGVTWADSEVVSSYATGDVTSNGDRAGGLIGDNSGEIANSYATGSIHTLDSIAGGLVGRNSGTVTNAYAMGDAVGNTFVGGLVGQNSGSIADSYAIGTVEATGTNGMAGGFSGLSDSNSTIVESYWDTQTSNISELGIGSDQLSDSDVEGINTGDFDSQAPYFDDWEFETIWTIGEAPDGQPRPIFEWQE